MLTRLFRARQRLRALCGEETRKATQMMDHEQYRSAIMADPRDPDPELREHRESCPECSAFGESAAAF